MGDSWRVRAARLVGTTALVVTLGCNSIRSDLGASNGCQECHAACSNGLVTTCLVLDPPGCGSQPSTQFCPYGCAAGTESMCNFYPVDGAVPSGCIANSVTPQQGALSGQWSDALVAVTSTHGTEMRVIVATGASAACASEGDAGVATGLGSGALLTMLLPTNFAGQVAIGSGASAVLTMWKNGALLIDNQMATSGSVSLNLSQPGGGLMGSYDLSFGSDEETGSFVAPECDICPAGS